LQIAIGCDAITLGPFRGPRVAATRESEAVHSERFSEREYRMYPEARQVKKR